MPSPVASVQLQCLVPHPQGTSPSAWNGIGGCSEPKVESELESGSGSGVGRESVVEFEASQRVCDPPVPYKSHSTPSHRTPPYRAATVPNAAWSSLDSAVKCLVSVWLTLLSLGPSKGAQGLSPPPPHPAIHPTRCWVEMRNSGAEARVGMTAIPQSPVPSPTAILQCRRFLWTSIGVPTAGHGGAKGF